MKTSFGGSKYVWINSIVSLPYPSAPGNCLGRGGGRIIEYAIGLAKRFIRVFPKDVME